MQTLKDDVVAVYPVIHFGDHVEIGPRQIVQAQPIEDKPIWYVYDCGDDDGASVTRFVLISDPEFERIPYGPTTKAHAQSLADALNMLRFDKHLAGSAPYEAAKKLLADTPRYVP